MKIDLPDIKEQQRVIYKEAIKEAKKQLDDNLKAPVIASPADINEEDYSRAHLLDKARYESPDADIVAAYFRQLQGVFPEYGTDKKLAQLLGVSSDRRIREYKTGARRIPYEIWDRFLVLTGRKPQTIIKVIGFMA